MGNEKCLDTRSILKLKKIGFAIGLDIGYKRKRGVNNDAKILNLT